MTINNTKSGRIRVLLADRNAGFLRVIENFLRSHCEIDIVGVVGESENLYEQIETLQSQVIVMELAMYHSVGLENISTLRKMQPDIHIIILTLLNPDNYRTMLLASGADDVVSKDKITTDLLPSILRVWGEYHGAIS